MSIREGFLSGDYHARFEAVTQNSAWRGYLRHSYISAAQLVAEAGWVNPITRLDATVLLCGTGSSETSSMYVKTVRSQNPKAQIYIMDFANDPLMNTQRRLRRDLGEDGVQRIGILQANALNVPFPDEVFTHIETDAFIQFFSPEEKKDLLTEWYRILRPGGIVTTRDFVQERGGVVGRTAAEAIRGVVARGLHAQAYSTTRAELTGLCNDAGLEVHINPAKGLRRSLPLMKDIIARRP